MTAVATEPVLQGPLQRLILPSGVELHHAQAGAGAPLIFVHGVMGDWQSWAPQWPAFCERFRCITYSRRYNHPNRNDMASPDHSAVIEAEDLAQFMDALGLTRVTLVASSYGAFIALALALRHPGKVAALVAVEPAMLCYAEFSEAGRQALARFKAQVMAPANEAFRRGDDELGARLMTGGIHQGPAAPALQGDNLARRLRSARAMRMLALSTNEFPLLPPAALAALACPVLLMSGANTAPIHAEVFRNVCQAMPQARCETVADAGHAVARDQPERFNERVLDFLKTALP